MMDDNINTDQILPSRFLSHISKVGFGKFLFANWRYLEDEEDPFVANPDFILNQDPYTQASILVVGENFAGGSSREHAVWALDDYGFRVVIAGSFSDIFYNNSFKNGLLALTLPKVPREAIGSYQPGTEITVDLENQVVITPDTTYSFSINEDVRHKLLNGIDDISETLNFTEQIAHYESKWNPFYE